MHYSDRQHASVQKCVYYEQEKECLFNFCIEVRDGIFRRSLNRHQTLCSGEGGSGLFPAPYGCHRPVDVLGPTLPKVSTPHPTHPQAIGMLVRA